MNNSPDASLKQCSKCPNRYPATSEFFPISKGRLETRCRECKKAYLKQYYESHKEQASQYGKQRYAIHGDVIRKREKQYRKDHEELMRERGRIHRMAHREEIREWDRQYYKIHREHRRTQAKKRFHERYKESQYAKNKAYRKTERGRLIRRALWHKREAQKKALGGCYTAQDIQLQYKRQKGKCYWCHKKLDKYHIDHVMPLSRGGANDPSNLVIACPHCNTSRKARLPHEWPEGNRLL